MSKNIIEDLIEICLMVFLGIIIGFLITRAVAPVRIVGESMNPSYQDGDKLMVNKVAYMMKSPEYGEVIVFKPLENLNDRYVKRVIGVPGDIVEIKDNKVYRNGIVLREDYIKEPMLSENFKEYKLKDDEYFLLGDNRNLSKDSRYFGPVNNRYIVGRVFGER